MSGSEYAGGSGRKGTPKPPRINDNGVTCQTCKKPNVMVYEGKLERHKIYKLDKNGRKTSAYSYCTQKTP